MALVRDGVHGLPDNPTIVSKSLLPAMKAVYQTIPSKASLTQSATLSPPHHPQCVER
jgi:hypothetical protein